MKRIIALLVGAALLGSTSVSAFTLHQGQTVRVAMPDTLGPVAQTAVGMLGEDLQRVLGADLQRETTSGHADIVGTIDASLPREGFCWQVSDTQLRITAADAHGMAYGLLELSRRLGVSPWEDWADAVPERRAEFCQDRSDETQQAPQVAYRGIFINDEDWGLNPWATRLEPEAWVVHHDRIRGAVGPQVTERIFRLMLRLRLNYYWPPMHECTQPFFLTPGNREVAARYGIYIGGSHCEPMASSAAAEWGIRGEGEYNYVTNREGVQRFWQDRLDSVARQEIVYTLGMRGVHDGAMQGVTTRAEKVQYLQQVIDDQRQMLAQTLGQDPTTVPQVFVPYKEVLDVYLNGLRVPDDVTLMWTDDNYGYVRHFPDSTEQRRAGGNGLYYHVSYWGRPHDYCWLSTLSPYLMEHQLTEAYHRGIQRVWMLNVGDIKPAEVQIHLFAELAWRGVSQDLTQRGWTRPVMEEMLGAVFPTMGEAFCREAVDCLDEAYRLAWDRKPEHLAGTRVEEKDKAYWNTVRPIEYWTQQTVERRLRDYRRLSDRVETLWQQLPTGSRDAFYQLVKYPVQAAAQMNVKYLSREESQQAHDSIQSLTQSYNRGWGNGGKWEGILSAAPRGLQVFQPVPQDAWPTYGEGEHWQPLQPADSAMTGRLLSGLGTQGRMLAVRRGETCQFPISEPLAGDSVTLAIHLLPTLPVDGGKLTFAVAVDDGAPCIVDYETYDRSEEWKRNVLRNCAERIVTLPLKKGDGTHVVTFRAMSEQVVVDGITFLPQTARDACR